MHDTDDEGFRMIIFINDVPVSIFSTSEEPEAGQINHVIEPTVEPLTQAKLINHVWIKNAEEKDLDALLSFLNSKVRTNLLSVYITTPQYSNLKAYFKSKFKLVKAAGGLIRKKEKFLMIYRLKKWDLPKGKKDKGEKYKHTAIREVEEECNVSVKLGKKICTTWHTYTMNRRAMLKKTKWYVMDCTDDSRMRPEVTEDIEEARWMTPKEVYHALEHSYKSISYVFEKYYDSAGVKSPQ